MAAKKSKAKSWYTIVSPKVFGSKDIGKTMVSDPDFLMGRKIHMSAAEMTSNFGKYYLKLSFQIAKLNGEKAYTEFNGSECMRDYISRMVLRHVRRIDTVQDLKTKDGVKIRVKGIATISRKSKSTTIKQVRKRIEDVIQGAVEKADIDDVVSGLLDDKMKFFIIKDVSNIYPIRNFEFRKTEILKR